MIEGKIAPKFVRIILISGMLFAVSSLALQRISSAMLTISCIFMVFGFYVIGQQKFNSEDKSEMDDMLKKESASFRLYHQLLNCACILFCIALLAGGLRLIPFSIDLFVAFGGIIVGFIGLIEVERLVYSSKKR